MAASSSSTPRPNVRLANADLGSQMSLQAPACSGASTSRPDVDTTGPQRHTSEQSVAQQQQIILVLCGLVGSGKSTFAQALCASDRSYSRACQDVLGSRQAVESYVRRQLDQGRNVCVDRTNADPKQRATWLDAARQYQQQRKLRVQTGGDAQTHSSHSDGTMGQNTTAASSGPALMSQPSVQVIALVFDTPVEVCRERLMRRTDHETLHTPEAALRILDVFSSQWVPPSAEKEGFHRVVHVSPADQEAGVEHVMAKVWATPATFEGPTRGALVTPSLSSTARRGRGRNSYGHIGSSNGGGSSYGWGALERRGRGGRGTSQWRGRGRGRVSGDMTAPGEVHATTYPGQAEQPNAGTHSQYSTGLQKYWQEERQPPTPNTYQPQPTSLPSISRATPYGASWSSVAATAPGQVPTPAPSGGLRAVAHPWRD